MEYVERVSSRNKKPEWFKFDQEMTDSDLEDELSTLVEYEVENLDNYDSFIDKLWGDVWAHTTSFLEEEQNQLQLDYDSQP